MASHRSHPVGGGHAVILVSYDSNSLTFLNSRGNQWGDNRSFRVQDHHTLELDGIPEECRVCFYDFYWLESQLCEKEVRVYEAKVDEKL